MTSRHYSLPGTSLRNSFRLWSSSDKRNAGAESDSEREREKDRSRHHRASLQHPSSSARDPRHSFSSSRPTATYPGVVQGSNQYAQEAPSSRVAVAPSHRPPSASGHKQSYRDHQPSGNKEPYPASSSTGIPPLSHQSNLASAAASPSATVKPPAAGVARTPSTSSPGAAVPTAPPLGTVPSSSSSTKQKESDGRTVFSRMFSRRRATSSTTPSTPQVAPTAGTANASGSGDKDKSRSGKHQRSTSMQAAVPSYTGATVASSSSPPHIEPPTIAQPQPSTWTTYEQSAPTPKPTNYSTARDSEREERTKLRKDKDRHRDRDREREDQQQHYMMREERARMERSRDERARQEYAASRRTDPTKSSRTERPSTSRRERERDGLMSDSDARAYDSSDSTRRRHLAAAAASSGAVPSMSHRPQRSDDIAGLGSSHVCAPFYAITTVQPFPVIIPIADLSCSSFILPFLARALMDCHINCYFLDTFLRRHAECTDCLVIECASKCATTICCPHSDLVSFTKCNATEQWRRRRRTGTGCDGDACTSNHDSTPTRRYPAFDVK